MTRFYRPRASSTSGSVRNRAFSDVMAATHRLLRADAPRDVEILANIIEPDVYKIAVSGYDKGTGPAPKGVLRTEDVSEMVTAAITLALESHDAKWFNLKQAAAASKHSPLVLEDPAVAEMSATQIAAKFKVARRTVFRWRKDLTQATAQDRKRWSLVTGIRRSMTGTAARYKRLREKHSKPATARKIAVISVERTLPPEIMNLLDTPVYPKMTFAGMLASLGLHAP